MHVCTGWFSLHAWVSLGFGGFFLFLFVWLGWLVGFFNALASELLFSLCRTSNL